MALKKKEHQIDPIFIHLRIYSPDEILMFFHQLQKIPSLKLTVRT